ncbi:hypothetical protein [Protofrankia symbiont of Coriaria ruscifolia]|nr:hypothetical protein [Protofrankia symbiont of Coriaria ruscifolia]
MPDNDNALKPDDPTRLSVGHADDRDDGGGAAGVGALFVPSVR